ncbi:MAG: hypothetical protein ACTSUV_05955 [Candidatus Ranarchaeia archaeon]
MEAKNHRLISLLETIRSMIPAPSVDISCLVSLLLEGATSKETARKLCELPHVLKLKKDGNIAKNERNFSYLTEKGVLVAKGALKTFPQLRIPDPPK